MRLPYTIATAEQLKILVLGEWLSVGDDEWMAKMSADINRFINAYDIFFFASHNRK